MVHLQVSKVLHHLVGTTVEALVLEKNAIRENRQKKFVTLSGFWPFRGCGGLSESAKKKNLWQKSFFKIMMNEVLIICEKLCLMMKVNIKQQEIKDLVAYLTNINKSYL